MATIKILDRNETITTDEGTSILDACLENGIEIDHVYEHLNGRCWEEDNPMPEYDDIFQGF